MAERRRILLVDDDRRLTRMLAEFLDGEGFDVAVAADGAEALERAATDAIDLVVLDVMMPGRSGFEVLAELRRRGPVPVLMLTARGEDLDRILGFELGADDYLTKPFNPRELAARIRAILRRAAPSGATDEPLRVADVELLPSSRTVRVGERPLDLTATEFNLLELLLARAGAVVTRDALSERALGRKLGRYDRSIDVHISHLRRKLGAGPDGRPRIATVRRIGYLYRRD